MEVPWKELNVCECLQVMLTECGFTSRICLLHLDENKINLLEMHIRAIIAKNANFIRDLPKCHASLYQAQLESQAPFSFVLSHRIIVSNLAQQMKNLDSNSTLFSLNSTAFTRIIKEIIECALNNANKTTHQRRYSDLLMDFAIYLFIISGVNAYEILSANLLMPSVPTIRKHMLQDKVMLIEGQLRCEELSSHLHKIGAPRKVYLSEDASAIVQNVSFDVKTNQLIGLVAPLKPENGCPKMFSYLATSEQEIERCMELPKSSLVYMIVAQPLRKHAPPFILQLFGTDNKFSTSNVIARWHYLVAELKKYGIDVFGFASDGDPKLLSSMRAKVELNFTELSVESLRRYFNKADKFVYIQDMIHIATKLRNCLLNLIKMLPMGDYQVNIAHIKILLDLLTKDVHGLVYSDICPNDRQNFASFEKITHDRVLESLEKAVFGSEATVTFLKMCKNVTSSFLDMSIDASERIYRMFHSLYFLRAWRSWLKKMKYKMKDNFITPNAYACIELNAHGLVCAIMSLRDNGEDELFLPHLMASQPCEHIFRQMRSMSTANWTKINFTLYELLHLISRVELMQELSYSRMKDKGVYLPRIEKVLESQTETRAETFIETRVEMDDPGEGPSNITSNVAKKRLPNDEEIIQVILKARSDALEVAARVGMKVVITDIEHCDLHKEKITEIEEFQLGADSDEWDEDICDEPSDANETNASLDDSTLANVMANNCDKYVDITNEDGSKKTIRKSTFVWLLTESKSKLSSERVKRVQGATQNDVNPSKRRKTVTSADIEPGNDSILIKSNEIGLGDWCIFENKSPELLSLEQNFEQSAFKKCLLGFVIGFKYIDSTERAPKRRRPGRPSMKKTSQAQDTSSPSTSSQVHDIEPQLEPQSKTYSLDYAPTKHIERKSVEVLATWYVCNKDGKLEHASKYAHSGVHSFRPIINYLATIRKENVIVKEINARKIPFIVGNLPEIENDLSDLIKQKNAAN